MKSREPNQDVFSVFWLGHIKKQWNLENFSLKERESVTGQCQLLKHEWNKGKTLLTDHIQSDCFVSTGAAVSRGLQTGEEAQIHHTRPSDQPAAT